MNEQSEPAHPPPFEPSEANETFCDAPMDDPGAGVAVRFAGCSVNDELKLLEVSANGH